MTGRLCGAAVLVSIAALPLPAQAAGAASTPLRVYAAASLTDVVAEIAAGFGGARLETSLGGSSALARQIRDGAPADVFLSASRDWVAYLGEAGLLAGPPVVFARNRLVCIAPPGGHLVDPQVRDARALLAGIGPAGRAAIADEGVPAGEYARAALRHLGVLDGLERRLVGLTDVRAVLHAVELGEVDAGFVYATDARVATVEVLFALPEETHTPVEYFAAVLSGAREPALARRFVEHLTGPEVQRLLAAAGFSSP